MVRRFMCCRRTGLFWWWLIGLLAHRLCCPRWPQCIGCNRQKPAADRELRQERTSVERRENIILRGLTSFIDTWHHCVDSEMGDQRFSIKWLFDGARSEWMNEWMHALTSGISPQYIFHVEGKNFFCWTVKGNNEENSAHQLCSSDWCFLPRVLD